ncbi:glycosyltransferase family 4 protein [Cereibacter sphaeroides]|nr:glycosyl transferase family 1 [Cereibacter sphaeroides]
MPRHTRQTDVLRPPQVLPSQAPAQDPSPRVERMRVLFTLGDPYLPQRSGGAQSSTDQLVRALLAEGHSAAVLSGLEGGGWVELYSRLQRRVLRRHYAVDRARGYPVFRTWDPRDAGEVIRRFRPHVAVVQNDNTGRALALARSFEAEGIAVVFYFRNVDFEDIGGDPASVRSAAYIANSRFTATSCRTAFGIRPRVIPPLVESALYRTESSRENVTFINPVPVKGLEIALGVAGHCPDIPFVFQESWPLSPERRAALEARLADLPNVRLQGRTADMKAVYGKARFVLAPSLWQEAWGRVATEAQFCGLPVIGSSRGGLPEAIGPGGLIVDAEAPLAAWVAAVRRLWDDPAEYERLAIQARAHAGRPEIQGRQQLAAFLDVLRATVSRGVSRASARTAHLLAMALLLV